MKIFVAGSLNMDLVINAPFMPKSGMTISGNGFMTNPGGKGGNQAVAVGNLGGAAYMVGCVGNAFGNELLTTLQKHNVNTQHVQKTDTVSSGIAVIVVVDGDNRIILDTGANGCVDKALIDSAFHEAQAGDYLVVQLEIAQETVAYALQKAKESGIITVLNPAPAAALPEDIFRYCDWFIPNQTEAEFYTGIYPEDEDSIKRCVHALKQKGIQNVLITLGALGSVCIAEQAFIQVPSEKVQAVDTTAAGDTYVGAFVTRLSEGASVQEAMRFASKAAAVTVTRRGAQQSIPLRNEVI